MAVLKNYGAAKKLLLIWTNAKCIALSLSLSLSLSFSLFHNLCKLYPTLSISLSLSIFSRPKHFLLSLFFCTALWWLLLSFVQFCVSMTNLSKFFLILFSKDKVTFTFSLTMCAHFSTFFISLSFLFLSFFRNLY